MAAWKVFLIGILGCICLGLALATIAIPISMEGAERWVWLGCLLIATILMGTMLTLFLRYAGESLKLKPRWGQN